MRSEPRGSHPAHVSIEALPPLPSLPSDCLLVSPLPPPDVRGSNSHDASPHPLLPRTRALLSTRPVAMYRMDPLRLLPPLAMLFVSWQVCLHRNLLPLRHNIETHTLPAESTVPLDPNDCLGYSTAHMDKDAGLIQCASARTLLLGNQ